MKITCPKCKRRIRIRRGERKNCLCGKYLDYRTFFRKRIPFDVFLLDANIFINAFKNNGSKALACRKIIYCKSGVIRIGTTYEVIDEVGKKIQSRLPKNIILYTTGKVGEKLSSISTHNLKQPSIVDLSLVKASIDHPEIHGLITYDKDFSNIAAAGIVNRNSSRKFWLGTAERFVAKKLRFNN